jgi:cardiolipin synthase
MAEASSPLPPSSAEPAPDRIVTVPNLITLVRLLCIPVFLWLLLGLEEKAWAALLLAVLGATDWVDGYVARHFDQVSNLGKAFDTIVDRLLLIIGVGSIIWDGYFNAPSSGPQGVPLWFGLVVVIREIVLSVWVVSIMAAGARRMDVTWWGKAGTFGLMVAFPAFLAASDTGLALGVREFLELVAWVAGIPGLVFSMIAFVGYFPRGLQALREGRDARAVAGSAA